MNASNKTISGLGLMASGMLLSLSTHVSFANDVMQFNIPAAAANAQGSIDFANAKPMPLPQASQITEKSTAMSASYPGLPGASKGGIGNGKTTLAKQLTKSIVFKSAAAEGNGDIAPNEFGTLNLPYTTSRVDMGGVQFSKYDYYRRAGKLFFKDGSGSYVCSASMIRKGVVVTAAHCVAAFGQKRIYSNFQYVPAYYNGNAPYGVWSAASVSLLSSYYNGTDSCSQAGVICQNDVALIKLTPQSSAYAGQYTGWYGYGWNGYGFTGTSLAANTIALITQLGYPVSHDGGAAMQRTDAEAYVASASSMNSIMGSRQTGGSSGGPWLANFGEVASLSSTSVGSEALSNVVVGVTSWGYTATAVKAQGASPFTSNNIVPLINGMCPSTTSPGC